MMTYKIDFDGEVMTVGFGAPAQNDEIVRDAVIRLGEMVKTGELRGGKLIKVNGPASLPVAMAIAHAVAHLYESVAVFDPKLGKYVVAIAHGNTYQPGDLID